MVGRFVLWSIGEEIFLVIFMTTLPNGIFFLYVLALESLEVKVGISLLFFIHPFPPSFSFLHSFLLLPPSLSPYLLPPFVSPSPFPPTYLPYFSLSFLFLLLLFLLVPQSSTVI